MTELAIVTLTIIELIFIKKILGDTLINRKDFDFWSSGEYGKLSAMDIIYDIMPKIEEALDDVQIGGEK